MFSEAAISDERLAIFCHVLERHLRYSFTWLPNHGKCQSIHLRFEFQGARTPNGIPHRLPYNLPGQTILRKRDAGNAEISDRKIERTSH